MFRINSSDRFIVSVIATTFCSGTWNWGPGCLITCYSAQHGPPWEPVPRLHVLSECSWLSVSSRGLCLFMREEGTGWRRARFSWKVKGGPAWPVGPCRSETAFTLILISLSSKTLCVDLEKLWFHSPWYPCYIGMFQPNDLFKRLLLFCIKLWRRHYQKKFKN